MRVGIDSYSYHRLFGEVRVREEPHPGPLWPPDPTLILEHARRLGVDEVYLEYLAEPMIHSALGLSPNVATASSFTKALGLGTDLEELFRPTGYPGDHGVNHD